MAVFNEKVRGQLKDVLKGMINPVTIAFFSQEVECIACREARAFLEEIAGLSDKLTLAVHDLQKDAAEAASLGIDKVPGITLLDAKGAPTRMNFFGIPGGYEINSFLGALLEASGKREALPGDIVARIATIAADVRIQVFISLTCPYCPAAVSAAHRIALESPRVRADMVDSSIFSHLAIKYQVSGVPKTVINETHELVGAQPLGKLLDIIEKL